jgi:hypothetical protein
MRNGPNSLTDAAPPARTWAEFETEAPGLAAFVRERLDAHKHKLMATIRADGWPRISGIEITIDRGELWIGGMPAARKSADLRRDPRVAIHSGSDEPSDFKGDARVTGLAVEIEDRALKRAFMKAAGGGPPGPFDLFRLAITEVSTVRVGEPADHLVINVWRPGAGIREIKRT